MGNFFNKKKILNNDSINNIELIDINDIIVKKALLIGINYTNSQNELDGCINDCKNLYNFLTKNMYFDSKDITIMDDFQKGKLYPTKKNILYQFNKLANIANSCKNKKKKVYLFVSYSGHGYYVDDEDGDESDGKDEALCPIDAEKNGYITDDIIKKILVDKMGENVKIVMLFDACHSGTIVDLKYNYNIQCNRNECRMYQSIEDSKCEVVVISGCSDSDISADAFIYHKSIAKFEFQGAMTASFLHSFDGTKSYNNLIIDMKKWLSDNEYTQQPHLSSGKFIDLDDSFLLNTFK